MKSDKERLRGYQRLIGVIHSIAEEQDKNGMVYGDKILSIIKKEVQRIESETK